MGNPLAIQWSGPDTLCQGSGLIQGWGTKIPQAAQCNEKNIYVYECVHVYTQSCLILCNPMAKLFCPWGCLGKNTGVGCHFLLQGIFSMQGLNLHLLRHLTGRQILYH